MACPNVVENSEPTIEQVERAARAWLAWQFPGRFWEAAPEAMKDKFREGARMVLQAAFSENSL